MKSIIALTMCSLFLLIGCKSDNKNNAKNERQPINNLQRSSQVQSTNSLQKDPQKSTDQQRASQVANDQSIYNIKNPVVSVSPYSNVVHDVAFALSSSERSLLTYKMLGVDGKETTATTLVFVPKRPAPKEGWSTVVWAHPTTGVADKCAPSQKWITGSEVLIIALLNAGYVVVAPDYEGLGSAGSHPYLNLKSEAYSITDAVAATRIYLTKKGQKLSKKWLSIGHSQGGHAVLGAAQYASRIQLDYKGTIAIAPSSNLEKAVKDKIQSVEGKTTALQIPAYAAIDAFISLVVAGTQGHDITVTYSDIFKPHLAEIAPIAERECMEEVVVAMTTKMTQFAALNGNSLAAYGRLQDNFFQNVKIKQFLEKDSQPLLVKVETPIIIYQGDIDLVVPVATTDLLYANATKLGTRINYKKSMIWDHFTVYTNNHLDFLKDVKTLMPIQ